MLPAYASRTERLWHITLRVIVALVLFFLIAPLVVIIPLSFNADSFLLYPMRGLSLRWYDELLTSGTWTLAFRNSLIVAPLSTLLAMILGTMAAIGLTRIDFPGKGLLTAILISPMVVPVVIVGVATYLFFAPLGLSGNFLGLVIVHAALGVPFVVTTVSATLQGFDFNLVRAAASLGANPLYTFFKVTLPLVLPGVISGGLFAFGTSFDEVVVTLFLASPEQTTLPRQMFSGIRENISPAIAAVATILTVFSVLMLLTLEWLRGRGEAARTAAL